MRRSDNGKWTIPAEGLWACACFIEPRLTGHIACVCDRACSVDAEDLAALQRRMRPVRGDMLGLQVIERDGPADLDGPGGGALRPEGKCASPTSASVVKITPRSMALPQFRTFPAKL